MTDVISRNRLAISLIIAVQSQIFSDSAMADDRSRNKAESSPELPPIGGPGIPDPPPSPTSPALDSAAQARPGAAAEPGSDYEIIHPIGRGSYGEVYLARDAAGAYRAVKVIFRESFEDDRPFQREYEGIRKFVIISRSYENQVQIFHVGRREQPNQFYYIMELADDEVNGRNIIPDTYVPRTLRSELKRRGRLPAKECLNIGVALTLALEDLHENGLVHRDVKPGNIIFVNHRPKLADIGLVTDTAVTVSYVGTEGFIAPEGPGSPAADLYSLGKVLYEMCTGRDRLDFPELPADFMALLGAMSAAKLKAEFRVTVMPLLTKFTVWVPPVAIELNDRWMPSVWPVAMFLAVRTLLV